MAKSFYEAFPQINLTDELDDLAQHIEVSRVSTDKAMSELRIAILCDRLVPWEMMRALERELEAKLIPDNNIPVRIHETFSLSDQYTLPNLLDAYLSSIYDEFQEYSLLEYNLVRHATFDCPDDSTLTVTIEDSLVAHQKEEEIYNILEKIINGRCGMQAELEIRFTEPAVRNRDASEEAFAKEANKSSASNIVHSDANDHAGTDAQADTDARADKDAPAKKQTAESAETSKLNAQSTNKDKKPVKRIYKKSAKRSGGSNPDLIRGRDFDAEPISIDQIVDETGEVVIRGKVIGLDEHEIRGEKTILKFVVTDETDSITVKIFCTNDELPEIKKDIYVGAFLMIHGMTSIDNYDHEITLGSILGIKKIAPFLSEREDKSSKKRVELHCHTKMSDSDGVADVTDLIRRAKKWGHRAIAVTDHGDVQAFTDAAKAVGRDDDFQIIYGMEAYLVEDLKSPVKNAAGQDFNDPFVVFDIETTGFSPEKNKIIEIGAVKMENGVITDRFASFVNPKIPIPYDIEKLTGIHDDMVIDAPVIEEVIPAFIAFSEGAVMVAHNAEFDMSFIKKNADAVGLSCGDTVIDTVSLSRILMPEMKRYRLDSIAKALHIQLENHHRAVDDAETTALIFLKFIDILADRDITSLDQLEQMNESTVEGIKKLNYYHAVLLAQNETGRVNLYRMVSDSHLKYFSRVPRIPKSELLKHREGILVGTACEAGELYSALLNGRTDEEVARIADFYDYFEIMPVGNNAFLLRDEKQPVDSEDDLRELNRRIVELGEKMNKPVVATGDVHFLDPQDEIYRRIIMYGKRFRDADEQAPLYLRTTDEMLEEFAWLGPEKAEEVVITNPNLIVDMCERIQAVRPDKCPPEIENSDRLLSEICYRKAHEIYGEELPAVVAARLERELDSIISNGFAMLYLIAQKLVSKSNEDGYLVGSRGSVGSSFAATMAGITEVNPLSPHYVCPNCHYTDFDSDEVKAFAGRAGCDMPDRKCPVCGADLGKDGFDIPFETFLGFMGEKEPDIDLNFSSDYQSKAHKYTEVVFGDGQTYRAGTIGTMAEKTAFGFVKNYYEDHLISKRSCEIERIVDGCVGVRRTTGQHPGGIIVLPIGEDINYFTPVQHPANDMESDIVTTHFDYHSIEHNLLKLDILGHVDPTMIRMLQDLTGIDPKSIPLDNSEVMSLFQSTSALGIEPGDISECPLGTLGIPEFGTDYAMQILIDTQPTQFSDLVRIAGLSHGTDVWGGNAQTLLREGKATISTAICTRDDIMIYLISKGMEKQEAFNIMERIRKGDIVKGKCADWPEWKQDMLDHGVPDWYVWSCEKIQYMFPKAHAAAYVMMAWRIAYWKLFYPLAYYAAYFSVRADAFDYSIMCQGKDRLDRILSDYLKRKDTLSKSEQDTLKDMRIVQEMYARGFEFVPLDIYRARAHNFQIIDGKLMPSIDSVAGMGDKAAEGVEEAAREGPFLSKDDFRDRSKVSRTVVEQMEELGLLEGLPETNQLSLFDVGSG